MTTATVGTMLDSARELGTVLERFLAEIRDTALDDNTRLLTYYLARLKRNLPRTLDLFTQEQLDKIRTLPLRTINSEFDPERCFDSSCLSPSVKPGELLEAAISLVDIRLCFYQWLQDQPITPEAKGLLDQLIKTEESSLKHLKKLQEKRCF